MSRRKKSNLKEEDIVNEVGIELRSILRQNKLLKAPICHFQPLSNIPKNEPKYQVVFDKLPPKKIKGLKTKVNKIKMPDEKISDDVLNFAQSVWHLKDRLKLWARSNNISFDVEKTISESFPLLVCSDIANRKKHGGADNRSGISPRLDDTIEFDTSQNGTIEFSTEGIWNQKELIVTKPSPIPWKVKILKKDKSIFSNNAVEYIFEAFKYWIPIIDKLGVLKASSKGNRSKELSNALNKL